MSDPTSIVKTHINNLQLWLPLPEKKDLLDSIARVNKALKGIVKKVYLNIK